MKYNNLFRKYLLTTNSTFTEAEAEFEAPSPFGDGQIRIDNEGRFDCAATGKTGDVFEFLKLLYPGLTDTGAKRLATFDDRISGDELRLANEHIKAFREDAGRLAVASDKLGVSKKKLKAMPVFMNIRGFRYNYREASSPSGVPLTTSTFTLDQPLRNIQGIFRMPSKLSERIWLVENSVQATLVAAATGETAMCWPTHRELDLYDYKSLFAGKQIVVLYGDLVYSYGESFYPFLEMIRSVVSSYAYIRISALCPNQKFSKWLEDPDHVQKMKQEAERCDGQQPISKHLYLKFKEQNDTKPVSFAQSSAREYFFYGTSCGRVAQSWPVDLLDVPMAERNFGLRFIMPERFASSIQLTSDRVIDINESVRQLTPKNTYQLIREMIHDHVYLENQDAEVLLSLWIMGTYVFSLFAAYPYLHLNAEYGSGKTTLMQMIQALSFNGMMASKITPARLMQEISDAQATVCLDEFEKNSGSQGNVQTQIFNSGYKRDGKYLKMRGENTDGLDLFSPKVFASIDGIHEDSLRSRMFIINLKRKPAFQRLDFWNAEDLQIIQRVNEAVNGGYALGLYHHQLIEYLIARLPRQIKLPCGQSIDGRNQELVTPLVVLAQLLDLDRDQGEVSVEQELFRILEYLLYPDIEQEVKRLKIFSNQLREWADYPEKIGFKIEDDMCWISNKHWDHSQLLAQFNGEKKTLLQWLQSFSDKVERETKHIPGDGTQSCTGFPADLTVNNKAFRDWFWPETASKAS